MFARKTARKIAAWLNVPDEDAAAVDSMTKDSKRIIRETSTKNPKKLDSKGKCQLKTGLDKKVLTAKLDCGIYSIEQVAKGLNKFNANITQPFKLPANEYIKKKKNNVTEVIVVHRIDAKPLQVIKEKKKERKVMQTFQEQLLKKEEQQKQEQEQEEQEEQ